MLLIVLNEETMNVFQSKEDILQFVKKDFIICLSDLSRCREVPTCARILFHSI